MMYIESTLADRAAWLVTSNNAFMRTIYDRGSIWFLGLHFMRGLPCADYTAALGRPVFRGPPYFRDAPPSARPSARRPTVDGDFLERLLQAEQRDGAVNSSAVGPRPSAPAYSKQRMMMQQEQHAAFEQRAQRMHVQQQHMPSPAHQLLIQQQQQQQLRRQQQEQQQMQMRRQPLAATPQQTHTLQFPGHAQHSFQHPQAQMGSVGHSMGRSAPRTASPRAQNFSPHRPPPGGQTTFTFG